MFYGVPGHTCNSQREVVDKVFVRANLQCEDKIETPYMYYSSNSFSDVCIHCGDPDNIFQEERHSPNMQILLR